MYTKRFFFYLSLISCFFFNFSYTETVFAIAKKGEIFNENEFYYKFNKISIRLEKEIIKDLVYDIQTQLLIFIVDDNNNTTLHKIASKQHPSDTFDDFKKASKKFTKEQIIKFTSVKNIDKNTILHEAAQQKNVSFILDFINWFDKNIDKNFENSMELFQCKNKDGKNFKNILFENKNIKYSFSEEIQLDNFFKKYMPEE